MLEQIRFNLSLYFIFAGIKLCPYEEVRETLKSSLIRGSDEVLRGQQ
jgi:hypothetical protein